MILFALEVIKHTTTAKRFCVVVFYREATKQAKRGRTLNIT